MIFTPDTSYQQWRELQDKLKERNKSKTSKRKNCKVKNNDEKITKKNQKKNKAEGVEL